MDNTSLGGVKKLVLKCASIAFITLLIIETPMNLYHMWQESMSHITILA
jgi:hypothetical protein